METAKQTELINTLLSQISYDDKLLCEPVLNLLRELEYVPRKHKKSTFVVEFEKYNRIIAKMEVQKQKDTNTSFLLWLRFSASDKYSRIFMDAVQSRPEAWIKRNQYHVNHDIKNCCGFCKGKPRFYHFFDADGSKIVLCGGYTKPVPNVRIDTVPEILRLIKEQDEYFNNILGRQM